MANQSAISMYKKNKFFQCGDRKNYYKLNETERIDAIVMSRILTKKK